MECTHELNSDNNDSSCSLFTDNLKDLTDEFNKVLKILQQVTLYRMLERHLPESSPPTE